MIWYIIWSDLVFKLCPQYLFFGSRDVVTPKSRGFSSFGLQKKHLVLRLGWKRHVLLGFKSHLARKITTFLQAGDQTRWAVQKAQVCGDGFRHSSGFTAAFQDEGHQMSSVYVLGTWTMWKPKTSSNHLGCASFRNLVHQGVVLQSFFAPKFSLTELLITLPALQYLQKALSCIRSAVSKTSNTIYIEIFARLWCEWCALNFDRHWVVLIMLWTFGNVRCQKLKCSKTPRSSILAYCLLVDNP